MTTETYWIVRNDDGEHLAGWWDASERGTAVRGFVFDTPKHTVPHKAATRAEAEALAAEHGGHVVEATVTERRVGLRWQQQGSDWWLVDGDRDVARIRADWVATVEPWLASLRVGLNGHKPTVVDVIGDANEAIDAAKAAAEAAVRATWGGGAA